MNLLNTNKTKIQEWLNKNIYSDANNIIRTMLKNKLITQDDIDNLYEELKITNYESLDEYYAAVEKQEPQQIYEWYVVSEEAYKKYKLIGYPVVKFNGICFYGRTTCGQPLIMDFYNIQDKLSIILHH